MIDHRFLRFVNYRRSLPKRQRDLLDGLTRKLLAAGPAAPLSLARETWWRWIQRALPRSTPAQCKAMATYAMAAFASGIINLRSLGQPGSASETFGSGVLGPSGASFTWQPGSVPQTAASGTVTNLSQLAAIQNELQNSLDSDNEISEMGSMQLQMLMDARSRLLQTASEIEKTKSDTENAMAQNIKW